VSADAPFYLVRVVRGQVATDVTARVVGLNYTEKECSGTAQSGGADRCKVDFDNFDLVNFGPAPFVRTGDRLEVSFGYPGNSSPPRQVSVTKVTGSVVLAVEALGGAALLHRHKRMRPWQNLTLAGIARAVAEEAGYGTELQQVDETYDVVDHVTQAATTDAQLMRELCRRTGWVWYVDVDGFHFHPRRTGQRPARKFVWYTDPGRGDVLSWNVENDIFARKAGGVTAKGIDPTTKKAVSATADNSTDTATTQLAPERLVVTGVSARDGTPTGDTVQESGSSTVVPGATSQKDAEQKAKTAYASSQLTSAQVSLECRGDPALRAKSVVQLEGFGAVVDGNYYAKEVDHKLGSSGYTMTVKVMRGGVGSGAGAGVTPAGPQNAATAPPDDPLGLTKWGQGAPLTVGVDARDGSAVFTDAGGRTADQHTSSTDPSAPADPLGLTRWGSGGS
jgi:phage protein D